MMTHDTLMHARLLSLIRIFLITALVLVAPRSEGQERPLSSSRRDSAIAAAREIMGSQRYCALITVDSTGQPQVRTMNPFAPDSTMTVWIATNTRSRKVEEIKKNPRVCLYYADHSQAVGYVAITGKAVLVDDMQEKLKRKRAYWDQAFPDWKYLVLIKVVPEKLDVLNYKWGFLNDSVTWRTPSMSLGRR